MSFDLANIREQMAHNRVKTTALLALTAIMIGLFVRAFILTAPRHAAAAPRPLEGLPATPAVDARAQSELEQRVRESHELWQVLNENRAMPAEMAFRFDSRFYHLDPSHQEPDHVVRPPDPAPIQTAVAPAVTPQAPVPEPPTRLNLQFTMLGADPSALINSRVVRVGDIIEGYRVNRIDAVTVTLEKNGIKYPLNMAKPDKGSGDKN